MRQLQKHFYKDNLLSIRASVDNDGYVKAFIATFRNEEKVFKVVNRDFLKAWDAMENWMNKKLSEHEQTNAFNKT